MDDRPTLVAKNIGMEIDLPGIWGERLRFYLRNGYSVSVIKTCYSYGGPAGKWEVAVVSPDGVIIGDVQGWLNPKNVAEIVSEVSKRPRLR